MTYKSCLLTCFAIAALAACQKQNGNGTHDHSSMEPKTEAAVDTVKKSVPKEEHAHVGGTHFTIAYHAPAVRGRTIWGGLVPYGEVWVTGAHSATSIEFDKDIMVNNTRIKAGKYAFFTIPGQEKWTLILNRNWDQHLADEYETTEDIVRVEVIPESMPAIQERLKYSVVDKGNSEASVDVRWEKVKISLPVKLQ